MSRSLRKTGLSYLFIGYLISVLFSAVSNLVKQVSGMGRIEDAVFADWLRYLEGTCLNELAFFAGFAIPGICMIAYTLPLLLGKPGGVAERRIINIPSAAALLVLLGWVFNFCLQYGVALYAQLAERQNFTAILIIFPLATVITAIPSITLTYLALEIFNRVAVLPRMFPDGNIFSVKGTEKPSLRFPCGLHLPDIRDDLLFYLQGLLYDEHHLPPHTDSSAPSDTAFLGHHGHPPAPDTEAAQVAVRRRRQGGAG